MSLLNQCPDCGASLDPNERCDCKKEEDAPVTAGTPSGKIIDTDNVSEKQDDVNSIELIRVRQLPVIEEQLRSVRSAVTARVAEARSMVCTEETYKDVKKTRSALNAEFAALEAQRKAVKAAILGPYEHFEEVYKECVADIYRQADADLKMRISEVEGELRQRRVDEVKTYYCEYRESLDIGEDMAPFDSAGIKIGLSGSVKSLKKQAKEYLDSISEDLAYIATLENSTEVLVEWKKTHNLTKAITAVDNRRKEVEALRQRREAEDKAKANIAAAVQKVKEAAQNTESAPPDALKPPVIAVAPEPQRLYRATFTVECTLDQMRTLKKFLIEGGYKFEQPK